jgi:hypothetical protein
MLTFEPTAVPRPVGQVGWRFLAPDPRGHDLVGDAGHGTAFLTLPLDDDCVYCYCDVVLPRDHETLERGASERLR